MPTLPAISACSRHTTRSNSPAPMDQHDDRPVPLKEADGTSRTAQPPQVGPLLGSTLGCTLAALTLLVAPMVFDALPVLAVSCLAGILLLAAAGFTGTLLLVQARAGEMRQLSWPQPTLAIGAGLLVGAIVLGAWHAPTMPPSDTLLAVGGGMVLLAFPILVLERSWATIPTSALAEAAGLAALLRAVLLVQIGLGLALMLQGSAFPIAALLVPALAALVLLLAAEFVLRGVAALFLPTPESSVARPAASSVVAACIRLRLPRLAAVNQAVTQQWGIDLSRSWALGFVGRALLPIGLLLALLTWGLTGLVALPLDQRAVYEQFGRPIAVLGPGLHLVLPWPLGVARRVELGVLHELTLAGPTSAEDTGLAPPRAEDPPPQGADRLWDRAHPGETTYLIASPAASGQGFQRVDVDLRLITRIGLSDAAALQATYGVTDPDALVRATAGRLLANYFASRTLAGVLGEDRATFTDAIRTALQQDLDRLATGEEIVAVVVEAIHPPPSAADAWHNVESAEIRARVAVADEAGAAAKTAAAARTKADLATYTATAAAAEIAAKATADQTLFSADQTANRAEPNAFRLERWLAHLRTALPRAQLLVLDHRLAGMEAPTLDLRDLAPTGSTPP
jgi:regulator of protease activity HflC (stomatin/prohibitin superfamily)